MRNKEIEARIKLQEAHKLRLKRIQRNNSDNTRSVRTDLYDDLDGASSASSQENLLKSKRNVYRRERAHSDGSNPDDIHVDDYNL